MKAALAIVLAALLITLPVEQVMAQAVQQQAMSVRQTAPDGAAGLFRVPPLTENAARLLGTSPVDALLPTANLDLAVAPNRRADELAPIPMSRGTTVAIGFLVLIVAVVVILLAGRDGIIEL